tara:strand:- start:2811 stop:3062 length:252 start_codon:yes stop_codon:yes gene_type:complete
MLIGADFNRNARVLLKHLAQCSNNTVGEVVEITSICEKMGIDKIQAKNLLEYLENKSCIVIHTFGGPYLYHDISITKKGLQSI